MRRKGNLVMGFVRVAWSLDPRSEWVGSRHRVFLVSLVRGRILLWNCWGLCLWRVCVLRGVSCRFNLHALKNHILFSYFACPEHSSWEVEPRYAMKLFIMDYSLIICVPLWSHKMNLSWNRMLFSPVLALMFQVSLQLVKPSFYQYDFVRNQDPREERKVVEVMILMALIIVLF